MKKVIALAIGMTVGGSFLVETPAYAGKGATTNAQSFFNNDGKRSKASQTPRRLRAPKNQKTQ